MNRDQDDEERAAEGETEDKGLRDIDHDKYVGRTNVADYSVPSGVQLTENLIEEIAEAVGGKTPEAAPEK